MSETIGTQLEASRRAQHLSIEDVAHQTRIHRDVLCQLEADEYSDFPNFMFLKSFLKLYSQHLGVDVSETLAKLEADASRHGEQYLLGGIDPLIRERYGHLTSRIPVRPILASVAALALLAFGGTYLVSHLYANEIEVDSEAVFPEPDLEDLAPSQIAGTATEAGTAESEEPATTPINAPAKRTPRAFPAVRTGGVVPPPVSDEYELREPAPIDPAMIPRAAPVPRVPVSEQGSNSADERRRGR
ncbi:MAG: helix-turn-helix domain-containing protein [Verrucomicrobiales bacterium]